MYWDFDNSAPILLDLSKLFTQYSTQVVALFPGKVNQSDSKALKEMTFPRLMPRQDYPPPTPLWQSLASMLHRLKRLKLNWKNETVHHHMDPSGIVMMFHMKQPPAV